MPTRIFIWVAHPKRDSLCGALADAYAEAARDSGAEVRMIALGDMDFDPRMEGYSKDRALEPDLLEWQQAIAWADHIMVIHHYWWGSMPAMARGVLDRALTPGFGYKYHARGVAWDRLLAGRTADIIITSDTPPLLDRVLYAQPGRRVLKDQILGFCGIKVMKTIQFGSVKLAKPAKIRGWIKKVRQLGTKRARTIRVTPALQPSEAAS